MEKGPFEDVFSIKSGDFSIALPEGSWYFKSKLLLLHWS